MRRQGSAEPLFAVPALAIPAGARVLIHGPSGRGKTTLLHLMAGQFPPDRGQVLVGGTDLASLDEDARCRFRRRHFGIVFQRFNLLDHLNAPENVRLGFPPGAERAEAQAVAALMRLGLESRMHRPCASLSPGERQRVAVARAVAARPDILLADEPTSSLDDANAEAVLAALMEASAGRTLVVVSHDRRIHGEFETLLDFSSLVGP